MTRALFWISLLTCTLMGLVHLVIGLSSFEPLTPNYVWFLAAGLAVLLAVALNIAAWRASPDDRLVRGLTHTANILMIGVSFLAVRAAPDSRGYATLLGFVGLLVANLATRRTRTTPLVVDGDSQPH